MRDVRNEGYMYDTYQLEQLPLPQQIRHSKKTTAAAR